MAAWQQLQQHVLERAGEASQWTRRLATEVQLLPDTMYRLRDGARNFQRAGEHLASSAKSLDEVSQLYERTVSATVRQSASALERLQGHVGRLPDTTAPDVANQINRQLRDAIDSLAAVNPLWPPSKPRSASSTDS